MLALKRSLPRTCTKTWYRRLSTLPPLPPVEAWSREFPQPQGANRISLNNSQTADVLVDAFLKQFHNDGKEGQVIIEAFPGPGVLTRSLLKQPPSRVKRIIVLEELPNFLRYLEPLEAYDPRVKVIPASGHDWKPYNGIADLGLLSDVERPWGDPCPPLQFISHIPNNVLGDQLVAQFFRSIPEESWLFKYGRVRLHLINNASLYERVVAKTNTRTRCKLSVIAEATSTVTESIPREALSHFASHFSPTVEAKNARQVQSAFMAMSVEPKREQTIEKGLLDKWDFVLRRLFVLKASPFDKAIGSLSFGANSLLKTLTDPTRPLAQNIQDTKKKISQLDVHEWANVVRAFDEWPFAPTDIRIEDSFSRRFDRGQNAAGRF